MSATSKIQWTDKTWNPTRGCSIVSPGCVNCYAMKQAHRFSGEGKAYEGLTKLTDRSGPQWTGKVITVESALLEPLSWRKPAKVFVNSMSDLFHEDVPDAFIDRVFAVMALAGNHTFQVLTKRPERMRVYVQGLGRSFERLQAACPVGWSLKWSEIPLIGWPLPNVWLGTSVENHRFAKARIPELIRTPAAVRFVSCEPLLENVCLDDGSNSWLSCQSKLTNEQYEAMTPDEQMHHGDCCEAFAMSGDPHYHGIDWVIVGGESGPGARPFDLAWARSIVEQCQVAGVPVFVKQLGARPFSEHGSVEIPRIAGVSRGPRADLPDIGFKDRKGGDPSEWPEDIRVRQFP